MFCQFLNVTQTITQAVTPAYIQKVTLIFMNTEEEIFFARNKIAINILKELKEKEWMAKPLSQKLNYYRETVSRILKRLEDKKYVICIKPESSNYRPYKITCRGKRIIKEVLNNSNCKNFNR